MAMKHGVYTGFTSAYNTYNANNHVAELEFNFADYNTRLARYWHNRRYADNTIYHSVNRYASSYKLEESLYKHIRGLRNPIGRLVQMETAKVFGGVINYETFADGAIKINGADDQLLSAIRQLYQWSNMDMLKTLYVREGATMGDIALKVVDDTDRNRVRLEVLDPRKVHDVKFDEVGNVKEIDIRYERQNAKTGKWHEYCEFIDNDHFEIFEGGNRTDGWDNPYGFVPVEWTQHVSTTLNFGVTSFHQTRHKIDNLNDLVTLIHDNVRKIVNAKFTVSGIRPDVGTNGSPTTLSTTGDNRDNSPIIYVGDGEMKALVSPLDISGALEAALSQQKEIENDLPQLALQSIRDSNSNLSGVAIKNMYSDTVDVFGELQGNYNSSLKSATQMAISIASFRRYDDFRGYNLDSYQSGVIDFGIRPKDLFSDELTTMERIEATSIALQSTAPELMLKEIGYSPDEIQEALGRVSRSQLRQQALAIREQSNQAVASGGNIEDVA